MGDQGGGDRGAEPSAPSPAGRPNRHAQPALLHIGGEPCRKVFVANWRPSPDSSMNGGQRNECASDSKFNVIKNIFFIKI
jgi:hypothetical protein